MMNKKMIVKGSLLMVLAGACGAAFADDVAPAPMPGTGQVKFVGAVVDAPCNIDAGSVDQTIQMGVLAQQSLYAKTTKVQPFDIKLTQCSTATVKSAVVSFTGIADAQAKADLSSGLKNVGIELSNDDGAVDLGKAVNGKVLTDGDNNLRFYAQAVYTGADNKTAPAQIGDFAAVSQFSVTYQ
ncbi:fimbrial protein [Aeromonas hydrophila]